MDLISAQNIFARRLYDWSLRDLMREMEEGCPLMSSVGLNNYSVAAFVSWADSMTSQERKILARALTRRAHENAAAARGEALTRDEQEYWNKEFFTQVTTRQHSLPPFVSANECLPPFKPVDPDKCLNTLAASLSPVLGKPSRRKSSLRATRAVSSF